MKVTKQEAAAANLDAAIDAFLAGKWVPAIHLAGAAEEVFGRLEEAKGSKTLPDHIWEKVDFTDLVAKKKDYIAAINKHRDWVKHHGAEHPLEIEIEEPHVVVPLMRACVAYTRYTGDNTRPSILAFVKWRHENAERLDAMVESWPD